MAVTYLVPISAAQSKSYLEEGNDMVGGVCVDLEALASVTSVAELIEILHLSYPDSPFSPDAPLDVLHVPTSPFITVQHAVGPLDVRAFEGGMIEFPPFTGDGKAGDTDLLVMPSARATSGTTMWRFHPGNPEPELMAVYYGIAFGWEIEATGEAKAMVPSWFLGPKVTREWGEVPCEVEFDDDGPTAVTLVAPREPAGESGFEQLESGMWAKRIAYSEDMDLHTSITFGKLSGIPVRLVRTITDQKGKQGYIVESLIKDAPYMLSVGLERWAPGVYTTLVPTENITDIQIGQLRPTVWDMDKLGAVTKGLTSPRDWSNRDVVLNEAVGLLVQTTPPNWKAITLNIQIVGGSISYEAGAGLNDGQSITYKAVPNAVIHYMVQAKKLMAIPGQGAPLFMAITLDEDKKVTVNPNYEATPPWADRVPDEAWRAELTMFPRDAEHTPEWLADRIAVLDS